MSWSDSQQDVAKTPGPSACLDDGGKASRQATGKQEQAEGRLIQRIMKATLNILGTLLVLMGAIWFLQGINILPGSFMTAQIRWAVYGGIAVLAGVALLVVAHRRRR